MPLSSKWEEALDLKANQEKFNVDSKGRKTGVLLPIRKYRQMLEDLHDLTVVAERRDEKPIPHAEMKRRL